MSESFKVSERATLFHVGEWVDWKSCASGVWKTKRGKVLAIVEPGENISAVLKQAGHGDVGTSRVKAMEHALNRRYLMLVAATGKATKNPKPPVFYAPLVKVLDGASHGKGRKVSDPERQS